VVPHIDTSLTFYGHQRQRLPKICMTSGLRMVFKILLAVLAIFFKKSWIYSWRSSPGGKRAFANKP